MITLGRYAEDPRVRPVDDLNIRVRRNVSITIKQNTDRAAVYRDDETEADFAGTVQQCLAYALGDPMRVGPCGMRQWLHTDGETYLHDPATTGMQNAGGLQPGDVVDWPHIDPVMISGAAVNRPDSLGRWGMEFPVVLANGERSHFRYGDDELVPVRFR